MKKFPQSKESARARGAFYEERAREFLQAQGYQIIEQNYRCKRGEIDLIAREGEYLCFVEVKFRSRGDFGGPLAAVDWKKRKRLAGAAQYYLMEKGCWDCVPCRFDVVGADRESIELVRNAFEL